MWETVGILVVSPGKGQMGGGGRESTGLTVQWSPVSRSYVVMENDE